MLHNIDGRGSPPRRRSTGAGGFRNAFFSVFSQLYDPPGILIMMREVGVTNQSIYLPSSTTAQWLIAPIGDLSWGWRLGCVQGSFCSGGPALPVARRTRGAARRAHAPEWSPPAGIRWEGAGWCGPIIKPAKHLQPTRVGQTLTEAGPGCAQIDDSTPPPRSPDATSPCAPERILTCVQHCGGVLLKRPPSLGTSCMGG